MIEVYVTKILLLIIYSFFYLNDESKTQRMFEKERLFCHTEQSKESGESEKSKELN
jgi:hypothetical protein